MGISLHPRAFTGSRVSLCPGCVYHTRMKNILLSVLLLAFFVAACTTPELETLEQVGEVASPVQINMLNHPLTCTSDSDCALNYTCEGNPGDPDPDTRRCVGLPCSDSYDCQLAPSASVGAEVCAKYGPAAPWPGGLFCVRSVYTDPIDEADCQDHDPHAWLNGSICVPPDANHCSGSNQTGSGPVCSGKADTCCAKFQGVDGTSYCGSSDCNYPFP